MELKRDDRADEQPSTGEAVPADDDEPTVKLDEPTVKLSTTEPPTGTRSTVTAPPQRAKKASTGTAKHAATRQRKEPVVTGQRTAWRAVLVVYVAGVLAAVALGAIAPVAPFIQEDLGASLAEVNWAASAITAVGAVLGGYLGVVARRRSRPKFVVTGLVLVAAMAFAGAVSWALVPLLLTRIVAGVGYLMVIIACPSLIAQLCTERDRSTALSVWGTFIPVGLSGSAWLGGVLQPYVGWRGWLVVSGLSALVLAMLVRATTGMRSRKEAVPKPPRIPLTSVWPVALLASGFCLISLTSLGVILLIPGFLIEERGMTGAWAGTAAAAATIASVPGSLLTGWLMARRVRRGWIACAGLLWVPAGFLVFLRSGPVDVVVAAAIAVAVVNGVLVSLVFATIPVTVAESSHLDFANGLVAQLGCLGTLLGPPLIGAVAANSGWGAAGGCVAITTILAVALLLTSLKVSYARRLTDEEVIVAVAGPELVWAIVRRGWRRVRR